MSGTSLLRWHVEVALDVIDAPAPVDFDEDSATRFHIEIYSEEWGVYFCHRGRASWIRVTDIAFVHGRDDHGLLALMPSIDDLGTLVRRLEAQHVITFQRSQAAIRTNLVNADGPLRAWLVAL